MPWEWSAASKRYRDTSSGRYLSPSQMTTLRDTFLDRTKERAAGLAAELANGDLTAAAWERQMRALVKATHVDLAALGKGGRSQMTPADWGRVGRSLRDQFAFLGRFADQTPTLSEAQVAARAGLYVEAGTATYERAQAATYGLDLPAYPGDGESCEGGTNCRCSWEITETDFGTQARWIANDDPNTCALCATNAQLWNPLIFPLPIPQSAIESPQSEEVAA